LIEGYIVSPGDLRSYKWQKECVIELDGLIAEVQMQLDEIYDHFVGVNSPIIDDMAKGGGFYDNNKIGNIVIKIELKQKMLNDTKRTY